MNLFTTTRPADRFQYDFYTAANNSTFSFTGSAMFPQSEPRLHRLFSQHL